MSFILPVDHDLSLRLLEPRHAQELFALIDRNREHLRPWFRWAPNVQSVDEVTRKIESWLRDFAEHGKLFTMIEARGQAVGQAHICQHDAANKRVELGYWLDSSALGKGYATRACRALIAHSFRVLGVNRIDIATDVDNVPSRAVAERLGFTHEADMAQWLCFPDGRCRDMASYRLLRRDWKEASS